MHKLLCVITVIALCLISCSGVEALDTATASLPGDTATSAPTSDVTPTSTSTSTTTPHPTLTLTPTLKPTLAATIKPTPSDCSAGFLVFWMAGFSFEPKDGLYIACADGSFFQQIVSDTTFFPNGQRLGRFAISPDGQQLALSIHHTSPASPRRSSIQFLDLGSFSLTEVYSTDSSISVLDWSADGEYIGYLVFNEHHDDLEILHLDTLTTSRVMKGDLESDEEYYSGLVDWEIEDFRLLDLDWSPDGEHILYVVVLLGPQVGATPGQIADITCSSQTHVCTIDNKQLLNWGNLRGMAWAPDMSAIVAARGIWETGDQFLEFRQIDGRLLRQIDLTTSFPGAALSFVEDIALSPEGGRVAFIAREDAGPEDVYVLRLGDLTLTNLTEKFGNTSASQVEWLP